MDSTWQSILDDFVSARQKTYSSADKQEQALIEAMAYALQTMLEKLRQNETTVWPDAAPGS